MSSKIYYRGQDWWQNELHCRHDTDMPGDECYKCQNEQFFNSHLISLAYVLLKLEITKKSLLPDADSEFILDFCSHK